MKPLRVRDCFDPKFSEFIVGPRQTESRGAYLVYGEVEAGEKRKVAPGKGHEEILLVLSGEGVLEGAGAGVRLSEGVALYMGEDFEGTITCGRDGDLCYVASGGHLPGGHGH
jgi:hypothetical protein